MGSGLDRSPHGGKSARLGVLAVLTGLPDVNYGGSVLLLVAVDFQNVEAMKILAEHGAKPSESIMDKAVGSKNFEII